MTEEHNTKLGFKEYRDLTIQSGLELIPVIGPTLSTAYFGRKQELRFKRIENFYQELSKKINELDSSIQFKNINNDNKDDITSMIEMLNDEIEKQSQQNKLKYFINYFINYMSINNEDHYIRYDLFFEILKDLSVSDLGHLKNFSENGYTSGILLTRDETRARIFRLRNYGLLEIIDFSKSISKHSADNFENKKISITRFGDSFYDFCLSSV
ncbi:hypothetical protein JNUCC1_03312 [Lentibacillus sp. JNUCC-1]|uniref:hypothetical protein n=1 Tax=Lentibacillus sp. JNUCC-1 TaxID=2654513 RepID=UPI0012E8E733|nr:hypothetical protein [Lentibacillus sp. JNUCC-1]MUV39434.1 hypothetical protein [Lentibacillus sp. JNUCC-1]